MQRSVRYRRPGSGPPPGSSATWSWTRFPLSRGSASPRRGVNEAFIYGVRASDLELTPGITSHRRTLHAQDHDIASLLRAGTNTVRLVLSDGWSRGRIGSRTASAASRP
ncbi:alpha-L-rhamnosidase N-terminal domain-containing protein [Amnibacterium sp.]|uniref:alpha-L-rhamnosidase N-terminal domain-containing protein n=1 Tax=Amnibacterium sp. TaxID=1872496 RepID=UPI003F7BFF60